MSAMLRNAMAIGLAMTSLGTGGCGLLLDGAYLVSNKRYEETVQERRPTGQIHSAIEYEGVIGADGQVHLTCEERERAIERASSVQKTFERRGSFDASVYVGTAALSGVIAGVVAGVMAGICLQKPEDPTKEQFSCLNMIYASPFVLDVGWSVFRASTAKPAKLVDKHAGEAVLAYSEKPLRRGPAGCAAAQLVLGNGSRNGQPSQDDVLNGRAAEPPPLPIEGAIAVAFTPDGTVALKTQPEIVKAWLDDAALGLWLVDAEGRSHALNVDRCNALRPAAEALTNEGRVKLLQACPPPPPPPSSPR